MSAPDRLIRKLAADIARVERKVAGLSRRMRTLEVASRRMAALRRGEGCTGPGLDALSAVLDAPAIVDSIQASVRNSARVEGPIPHLLFRNVLPPDAYDVLVAAVPPEDFFDEDDDTHLKQLIVRTSLMPLDAMITWMFVTDVVAPLLAAEAASRPMDGHDQGAARIISPRVVRRTAGYVPGPPSQSPDSGYMAVINLARAGDTSRYGSYLHAPPPLQPLQLVEIPFEGNSALLWCAGRAAHRYAAIPEDAGGLVRDAYQFGIDFRAR